MTVTGETWPWPAGAATGIGSLPGTDIAEAQRIVLGELPDLPHLPELPARGPGADMIGRTRRPAGRAAGRALRRPVAGRRRARAATCAAPATCWNATWTRSTEPADGYAGPLKVQAAGPWTLAASLELPIGGRLLRDHGAVRDLADSLAEGLRAHVADVRPRLPGAPGAAAARRAVAAGGAGRPGADRERAGDAARGRPGPDAATALRTVVDGGRRAGGGALLRPGRAAASCSARPAPPRVGPRPRRWSTISTRSARRSTPASACFAGAAPTAARRRPVRADLGRRSPSGYASSGDRLGLPRVAGWPRRSWSRRPAGWPAPPPAYARAVLRPAARPAAGSPRRELSVVPRGNVAGMIGQLRASPSTAPTPQALAELLLRAARPAASRYVDDDWV